MKFSKKLLCLIVLSLLASFTGMVHPVRSQEPEQPKLVVFESVGSVQ